MEQLIILTKNFNDDFTAYVLDKKQTIEEVLNGVNDFANIKIITTNAKYITTFYKEFNKELTDGKYQLYSMNGDMVLIWRNTLPRELDYITGIIKEEELLKRFKYRIEE